MIDWNVTNVLYIFSCWLNYDTGFVWSFIGPVILIIIVS